MTLLKMVHFDVLAEKSGVEAFLKQGNLEVSRAGMRASLVYWILILVVLVTVSNSLGLHMVVDLFNKVVLYIPNVIAAILVLMFGSLLARFVNRPMFAYFNNIGVEGALTRSTFCEYAVPVFVLFVALEQLESAPGCSPQRSRSPSAPSAWRWPSLSDWVEGSGPPP